MLAFRRLGLALAPAVLLGCTPLVPPPERSPQPVEAEVSPEDDGAEPEVSPPVGSPTHAFAATLSIDERPGGKKFQGVWLEGDDGVRRVISYRADPWWRPFEGRSVEVEGWPYEPRGQAIAAAHFRVEALRVVAPGTEDALVSITGERELVGSFAEVTAPKGTKRAGETRTVFRSEDGKTYESYRLPQPQPPLDRRVRVTARFVEPSPFIAHLGGTYLWVIAVETSAP
jgi:hypothetical protein